MASQPVADKFEADVAAIGSNCATTRNEIEALVRLGLLSACEQTNRNAIIKAMYAFFDRTLGRSRDAQRGRCNAQRKAAF
jgi:hypothetical protein